MTQNASDVLSSRAFICLAARFPSASYKRGLELLSGGPLQRRAEPSTPTIDAAVVAAAAGSAAATSTIGEVPLIDLTCPGGQCTTEDACTAAAEQKQDDDVEMTDPTAHGFSVADANAMALASGYGIAPGDDIVDWEAVRVADPAAVCDAIRCRGMYYMLTERIQKFLNKIRREGKDGVPLKAVVPQTAIAAAAGDQAVSAEQASGQQQLSEWRADGADDAAEGVATPSPADLTPGLRPGAAADAAKRDAAEEDKMSLEWLRDAGQERASGYLMNVAGLGRKSTGCVMLLSLGMKEFPVDTNVARVCAR